MLAEQGRAYSDLWEDIVRHKNTYTNWRNLTTELRISDLEEIAKALHVSPAARPTANMPELRMEDFEARCPGVHRRSLQRDLRALIEKHLIVAEGATNRLIYRVAGKP